MRSFIRKFLSLISIGGLFFIVWKAVYDGSPFTLFGTSFGTESAEGENIYDTIGGDFVLQQANGAPYKLFKSNGKVRVLFFGFTTCPEICPNTLTAYQGFYAQLSAPEREQIEFIFVSVDPERDLPVMESYLSKFAVPIIGLCGSVQEIDRVVKQYAAYYERIPLDIEGDYTIDHSTNIYIIDFDGEINSLVPYNAGAEAISMAVMPLYQR